MKNIPTDPEERKRYFYNKWDTLDQKNNFIFLKMMQQKDLYAEVLSVLCGKEVKNLKQIDCEKYFQATPNSKSVRMDTFAEDENTIYNLEMQTAFRADTPLRIRYYHAAMDTHCHDCGIEYENLKQLSTIFLCDFDLYKYQLPRYTIQSVIKELPNYPYDDRVQRLIYNFNAYNKVDREKEQKLYEVLGFFAGAKLAMASDSLYNRLTHRHYEVKMNENWRLDFMNTAMREYTITLDAKKEGILIGREEGMLLGKEEGMLLGREEGAIIGAAKKEREIARNLILLLNADDDAIINTTGLNLNEVRQIRKECEKNK